MTAQAKRGLIILGVVAVAVVIALVVRGLRSGGEDLTQIQVHEVSRAPMEERLSGTGSFVPDVSMTVYAKVSGTLQSLEVKEGDRVDAGDLLARIDNEEYLQAYRQAEIALETTRRNAYQGLMNLRSTYKNALLSYNQAKRTVEKNRELKAVDAITEDAMTQSQEAMETAQLAYTSAREQLNVQLGNPLGEEPKVEGELDWAIIDALPETEQARLNLESAARSLAHCEPKAPIAGTVTQVMPSRGDLVAPNSPLFKIEGLARMRAEVLIDEVDIGKILKGSVAEVTSDSILGDVISGRVTAISPTVQKVGNTRMSTVTIELEQKDRELLAGASCTARIVTVSKENAVVIPLTAYRSEDGKDYVFKVNPDENEPGTALLAKTQVTLGLTTVTLVEVLSGLQEGDEIALGDPSLYRDGIRVRLPNTEAAE